MANSEVEILKKNLTIEGAIDSIRKFEDNQSLATSENMVKWKNYHHQVVVESDSHFYKVYEELNFYIGPFCSLIRNALAGVYSSLGINWKIITFEQNGSLYDFEQREKLKVAEIQDGEFEDVLLSCSYLLDEVERILEFDNILEQLKQTQAFKSVNALKLVRNCVNKYADYAMWEGQAVLLDDADFYIALVDRNGEIVDVPPQVEVPVKTSYGNFLFTSCTSASFENGEFKNNVPANNEVVHGWYLFKERPEAANAIVKAGNDVVERQFVDEKRATLTHNIEVSEKKQDNKSSNANAEETRGMDKVFNSEEEITETDKLYSNNLGRRSFQWELWQCCNNLCRFCYLGHENRHTDKERQLKSLNDLKENLDNLDFTVYNNVSLIGGEFFQGQLNDPDVNKSFFEMIETLCNLYVDKKIGSIWITATLTIGDQADLYKMLEMFNHAGVHPLPEYGASGVWICTSWDPKGRFHTEKHLKNWEFHMKNIEVAYPGTKKNTTIILSQPLCEMYLEGKYVPHDFMREYGTLLFYKQPGFYQITLEEEGLGELGELLDCVKEDTLDDYLAKRKQLLEDDIGFRFYPDRKTFRKFLIKYAKDDPDTFERLFNIKFRADELHRNFNRRYDDDELIRDKNSNFESSGQSDSIINEHCKIEPHDKKHIINYSTYADCCECMLCDRNQIWESVHGSGN